MFRGFFNEEPEYEEETLRVIEMHEGLEIHWPSELGEPIYVDGDPDVLDIIEIEDLVGDDPVALSPDQAEAIIDQVFGDWESHDEIIDFFDDHMLIEELQQAGSYTREWWNHPDRLRYNPKEGF